MPALELTLATTRSETPAAENAARITFYSQLRREQFGKFLYDTAARIRNAAKNNQTQEKNEK